MDIISPAALELQEIIFPSIMEKTPTHALFTQRYISLAC